MAWCSDSLADGIAQSIAQMEGYWTPGSVAARNNNPGNIMGSGGFNRYATPEAGIQALCRQVGLNINRGLTLEEFFGGRPGVYPGYAPAGHGNNDPSAYAAFVAGRVGLPVDVPLTDLAMFGSGFDGGPDWVLIAAAVGGLAALYLVIS